MAADIAETERIAKMPGRAHNITALLETFLRVP